MESAYSAASEDLNFLSVSSGLSHKEFRELIADNLRILPVVKEITSRARNGITDVDAIELIDEHLGSEAAAYGNSNQWEILRAWLLEFFPDVYRQGTFPEVFLTGSLLK